MKSRSNIKHKKKGLKIQISDSNIEFRYFKSHVKLDELFTHHHETHSN